MRLEDEESTTSWQQPREGEVIFVIIWRGQEQRYGVRKEKIRNFKGAKRKLDGLKKKHWWVALQWRNLLGPMFNNQLVGGWKQKYQVFPPKSFPKKQGE